jgi:cyclic pyranopterin phosphate synthase
MASSHLDAGGRAIQVDVSDKHPTRREALAGCTIRLSRRAFDVATGGRSVKGDTLAVARLAGIQAAKKASDLIPLCHPLGLEHIAVSVEPDAGDGSIRVIAKVIATARTGVEMEALTAAGVAGLTVYDMIKSVDPLARVTDLMVFEKFGGEKNFRREDA